MGLLNHAHAIFHFHREQELLEGSILNCSMNLVVGLNKASPRIKHIIFVVFYLEKRRMMGIKHLVSTVGMDIIGRIG
jgi:hypothetical protein